MQAAGHHVGPTVVAVQRRGRAVRDAVAEAHHHAGVGRRHGVRRVQEEPGRGAVRERAVVLQRAHRAGIGRRDVGRGHRLGVPGHRPAVTRDVERDGELAPGHLRRVADEGQRHGIGPDLRAGRHRDRLLAGESDRPGGAGHHCRAAHLKAGERGVERHGTGAEAVGQAEPHLPAPEVGLDDQPETLLVRPGIGVRERERQVRLGARVAHWVGSLVRAGPHRRPALGRGRGCAAVASRAARSSRVGIGIAVSAAERNSVTGADRAQGSPAACADGGARGQNIFFLTRSAPAVLRYAGCRRSGNALCSSTSSPPPPP